MRTLLLAALFAGILPTAFSAPSDNAWHISKLAYDTPQDIRQTCAKRHAADPHYPEECVAVNFDLLDSPYPQLNRTVNGDIRQEIQSGIDELREEWQDGASYSSYLERHRQINLLGHAGPLTQIAVQDYRFSGGAHGMPSQSFYVFNRNSGQLLKLDDILLPGKKAELEVRLLAQFKNFLQASYPSGKQQDEHLQFWPFELTDNFYFTPEGITFVYNPYQLGPYAMGFVVLHLDKKAAADLLQPPYRNLTFEHFQDIHAAVNQSQSAKAV